jgi:hypothetical protein
MSIVVIAWSLTTTLMVLAAWAGVIRAVSTGESEAAATMVAARSARRMFLATVTM